jgi:hypothetical protein
MNAVKPQNVPPRQRKSSEAETSDDDNDGDSEAGGDHDNDRAWRRMTRSHVESVGG